MGVRKKLKSLFCIKFKPHRARLTKKSFPRRPSPAPNPPPFYQLTNRAIPDLHPRRDPIPTETWEPLTFQHKPYTTSSGVVIPPDFSYDRHKPIYQVSNLYRDPNWHPDLDSDDSDDDLADFQDESSDTVFDGDDEATTVSDYSLDTLSRMTELALTAHRSVAQMESVEPRPLPEVPSGNLGGDRVGAWVPRRGVRILAGGDERSVNGIWMLSPEGTQEGSVRFLGGDGV